MVKIGNIDIREAPTLRFIAALTAAMQGVMGMAVFGDLIPDRVGGGIALGVAFVQFFLAAWNSGLHNDPVKPYEPPKI
jgi:hypothetical protein